MLVVDDSPSATALLSAMLRSDPEIEVVGAAADGAEAVEMAGRLRPDVVTMDIEMPGVDGLEATRRIMRSCPTRVVIVTGLASRVVAGKAFTAMEVGALTVLHKPAGPSSPDYERSTKELVHTVKLMSSVPVVRLWAKRSEAPAAALPRERGDGRRIDIVAIAASTGGPAALSRVLGSLGGPLPVPMLVVQHLASGFDDALVRWLDAGSAITIVVAEHDATIEPGVVYVAPQQTHLAVRKGRIALEDGEPISGHRPSATVLFRSLATGYGRSALGVVLTGMGADGADGAADLARAGGLVWAQDEDSSVVYGMPKAVVERGVAARILPLDAIGPSIASLVARP